MSLPIEIIESILKHNTHSQRDLFNSSLVNQSWHKASTPMLLRSAVITFMPTDQINLAHIPKLLVYQADAIQEDSDSQPPKTTQTELSNLELKQLASLGRHAQSLILKDLYSNHLGPNLPQIFSALLGSHNLCNLQNLRILGSTSTSKSFTMLSQMLTTGCLTNIRTFQVEFDRCTMETGERILSLRFPLLADFRAHKSQPSPNRFTTKSLLEFIASHPLLESLQIPNLAPDATDSEDSLKELSKLRHLYIWTAHGNSTSLRKTSSILHLLSQSCIGQNLETFSLKSRVFDLPSLQHFLSTTPNLKQLSLSIHNDRNIISTSLKTSLPSIQAIYLKIHNQTNTSLRSKNQLLTSASPTLRYLKLQGFSSPPLVTFPNLQILCCETIPEPFDIVIHCTPTLQEFQIPRGTLTPSILAAMTRWKHIQHLRFSLTQSTKHLLPSSSIASFLTLKSRCTVEIVRGVKEGPLEHDEGYSELFREFGGRIRSVPHRGESTFAYSPEMRFSVEC
ncbi:hypothetical protein HDU97_006283 [Phlyctochytrium planicorne]|nr:hypothetical protein HDU97_006283 [Phlyctochytrium planicorne]